MIIQSLTGLIYAFSAPKYCILLKIKCLPRAKLLVPPAEYVLANSMTLNCRNFCGLLFRSEMPGKHKGLLLQLGENEVGPES
jgi:hypothetical protein